MDVGPQTAPLADLTEWPDNPRRVDDDALARLSASLEAEPDLLNARPLIALPDGVVIAGNMRLRALRAAGATEAPVYVIDADPQRAREIALRDNNQYGEWEDDALAAMLADLTAAGTDPLDLGFDSASLDRLMAGLAPAGPDPDDAPPTPPTPVTKAGDLIQLGAHVLVCGDAGDSDVIDTATSGDLAAMVWTDPPYGVDYEGGTKKREAIKGDDGAGTEELVLYALGAALDRTVEGGGIYVACPDLHRPLFERALRGAGWRFASPLIWSKGNSSFGRQDYHWNHEGILYGWKPGAAHRWYGDRKQTTVIEVPRPSRSDDHPTMKPIALIEPLIANSSQRGDVVLDPFGGSGSTLIACERMARRCCMVEVDPGYCDVIVARWEKLTGKLAQR